MVARLQRFPRAYRALRRAFRSGVDVVVRTRRTGTDALHPADPVLFGSTPEAYLARGRADADLVEPYLVPDGSLAVYGSGFGQVLRHVTARHPGLHVVAVDADPRAVRFCARHFGAEPVAVEPGAVPPACDVDVVWGGAVLSHVDGRAGDDALRTWRRAVRRRHGVVIFTTRDGAHAADTAERRAWSADVASAVDEQLRTRGFAHAPYPHDGRRGPSFHDPDRTGHRIEQAGLEIVERREIGPEPSRTLWVTRSRG